VRRAPPLLLFHFRRTARPNKGGFALLPVVAAHKSLP